MARPSGLQYRVLRSGTGRRPGGNDVHIGYGIRLINGTLVESTTPVLPAALAMASVPMAGLAEALALMHVGDRWQLVPANLALGEERREWRHPAESDPAVGSDLGFGGATAPGQTATENPFSVWGNGRENGASLTIRP